MSQSQSMSRAERAELELLLTVSLKMVHENLEEMNLDIKAIKGVMKEIGLESNPDLERSWEILDSLDMGLHKVYTQLTGVSEENNEVAGTGVAGNDAESESDPDRGKAPDEVGAEAD
jgi:hypothetical protein